PCAEISGRLPRLLSQQDAPSANEQNRTREIANEHASRNPVGHQLFERNARYIEWMEKMLGSVKYRGEPENNAAYSDQRFPGPVLIDCCRCKNPAASAERHLAEQKRPVNPIVGLGESSWKVHRGHENKHHDSEQQPRPPHLNLRGNAQRRSQQSEADE